MHPRAVVRSYGQTSSGKSYSMGTALDAGSNDEREILPSTGLVPRAVHDIFAKCAEMERQAGGRANVRFEMTNSFVELYNEVRPPWARRPALRPVGEE